MNQKGFVPIVILLIVLVIIAIGGFWYYSTHKSSQTISQAPPSQSSASPAGPLFENPEITAFVPVTQPPNPDFLGSISSTSDVSINFSYEGSSPTIGLGGDYESNTYHDSSTNEDFFLIPDKSNQSLDNYGYGDGFTIFSSRYGHAYEGTPIIISNASSAYTLSYLGFKISDPSLIGHIDVEVAVDFQYGSALGESKSVLQSIAELVVPKVTCACGPGEEIKIIGDSNLDFIKEDSAGISWYKLENPISLYNLPQNYCGAGYSDAPDEDGYDYCPNINLDGGVRMQIYYLPNNKEGPLQLQVASVILQDQADSYEQTTMGSNYSQYYRSYLTTDEQGKISLQYDSSTSNLDLAFENVGSDSISLDEYSFDAIQNFYPYPTSKNLTISPKVLIPSALKSFSIVDAASGNVIQMIPLDILKNKLEGAEIVPGLAVSFPIVNKNALQKDKLYYLNVDFESETASSSPTPPRFITWNVEDISKPLYTFTPAAPGYADFIYLDDSNNLDVIPIMRVNNPYSYITPEGSPNTVSALFYLPSQTSSFYAMTNPLSWYETVTSTQAYKNMLSTLAGQSNNAEVVQILQWLSRVDPFLLSP